MVSVCCVTYNHEKYIAEALNSFLMQKTTFQYEIIIGEDCSLDNTRKIIEDYCLRHPDKIKLVTDNVNVGAMNNQTRTFSHAKGKYIAMCDGDDYWTDPFKLQKQVDFMESQSDSAICCHYSRVIDENGELVYEHPTPIKLEFDYGDVLLGKKEETRTCSVMLKNNQHINEICQQNWYQRTHGADTFLKLYALENEKGKLYVLPEVMSVYRLHKDGIWSMIDAKVRKNKMISDFNILIRHFNYSDEHRRALLKIYISQFLLFDIKNLKIKKAINTLRMLL